MVQVHVPARVWGFESLLRHQDYPPQNLSPSLGPIFYKHSDPCTRGPARVMEVRPMSPNSRKALFAVVFVSLFVASAAFAQAPSRVANAATDLSSSLEATARRVGPTVVEIFTTSYTPGEGMVPRTADLVTTQRASGSGVIVDPEGYIVTNAHVVRGAQRLRVEVPSSPMGQSILASRTRSLSGHVVGIDTE